MRRDCEVTAHQGRCWLQYLQQAHRRELTCECGIECWRRRGAAENAMVASVAGDDIGPAWGLFGGRLGITMADERERIARAKVAGRQRQDAKQNSVQRDRIDRCQAHCPSDAHTHDIQCPCRDRMKPITT